MSAVKTHVYFFRGLSTYGHDDAKWSVFDFGPVYKRIAAAFEERGVVFHPVTGMGAGTLEEISARAIDFFRADPIWNSAEPVHFLGHSAGGLAARLTMAALLADPSTPPGKILSLLTIAAPNRGAGLARVCIDMPRTHLGSVRFLRLWGYDVVSKRNFFETLTAENIGRLFAGEKEFPVRRGSIVCACPRREWCWPLRLFYMVRALSDFREESDGVVEKSTQPYGEVLAELRIDHFRQVGLFGKRSLFEEMIDIATNFFWDSAK